MPLEPCSVWLVELPDSSAPANCAKTIPATAATRTKDAISITTFVLSILFHLSMLLCLE